MDLDQLALRQFDDYVRGRHGLLFADPQITLTIPEAYQLQREVVSLRRQRGEMIVGYKIGCVSEVVRAQLGLDRPVFGHIFGSEVYRSGCVLKASEFTGLAIEGEYAVRLSRDVPSLEGLRADPAQVIRSVFPVIELHHYVFRGVQQAQELIGNNAMQAGIVLPAHAKPFDSPQQLKDDFLVVSINGEERGRKDDDALWRTISCSVIAVAEHLEESGVQLTKDQVVLTGSPLPLYRVQAGDRIEIHCRAGVELIAQVV